MNTQRKCWLSCSIFVSMLDRHIILAKTVKPLISELQNRNEVFGYRITFNNEPSSNIRLSLKVAVIKKYDLARNVDNYLTSSLRDKTNGPHQLPSDKVSLFKPFLNNSVQYGLYTKVNNDRCSYLNELEVAISLAVINALGNDPIDEQALLTLSMYLLFICYKVIGRDAAEGSSWVEYYQYLSESIGSDQPDKALIKAQYDSLSITINEILTDTSCIQCCDDLSWTRIWEDAFTGVWLKIKNKVEIHILFAQFDNLVNDVLNLDPLLRTLKNNFIVMTLTRDSQSISA